MSAWAVTDEEKQGLIRHQSSDIRENELPDPNVNKTSMWVDWGKFWTPMKPALTLIALQANNNTRSSIKEN